MLDYDVMLMYYVYGCILAARLLYILMLIIEVTD